MKKKYRFTLVNFAKLVVKRQIEKDTDTFVVIYGSRRTGKTTLGFKMLFPYLTLQRKLYRNGRSSWNVPNSWKILFRNYFAGDCEDMLRKIKRNPERSFTFVDEGADVMSWHHMLEKEQQDLVELILKAGKKKLFTIFLTPTMKLLRKEVLANAHYLFIVPQEPRGGCNYAYVFRNYENPILKENIPFGFKKIEDSVLKSPMFSERFFDNLLMSRDRFVTKIKFTKIPENIYNLYDVMVKDPLIMKERRKRKMVSYERFYKLQYMFDNILYNLYVRDGKSLAQIENLLRDKFGDVLLTKPAIKRRLDRIMSMEKKPALSDTSVFEGDEAKEDTELADISLDESLERLKCEVNASN